MLNDKNVDIKDLLYDKKVHCPVCEFDFSTKVVKVHGPRIQSKDSDFFIRYSKINPYFYDVWICPCCGYAAMKSNFEKLRSFQKELIQKNISINWKGQSFPELFDEKIAIQRYKLALVNAIVSESRNSVMAMISLKIAWMYRLLEDEKNELSFLGKALNGFLEAYESEPFPIFGMDQHSLMYLIGELYRRTGNYEKSMLWLGNIVVSTIAPARIKEMARNMRNLAKEAIDNNHNSPNIPLQK